MSYKGRRSSLAKTIKNGLIIVPAGSPQVRSHDTEFPFRQNSNFKYLTGFYEPQACLLIKVHDETANEILFVRPKDELAELWCGSRTGVEKAKDLIQVDQTFSIDELTERLSDLMEGHEKVYFDLYDKSLMPQVLKASRITDLRRKKKVLKPNSFHHLPPIIGRMRLIKEASEIQSMKKAARASEVAHKAAMALTHPGKNESEIHNLMEYLFRKEGAEDNAYEPIVAGGTNGLILHYIENNSPLKTGETLLIDAGAQVDLYASDVTRTFPISGTYTGPQKDIYALVLKAQKKAFELSIPGKTLGEIHKETSLTLIEGMIDLKILQGDPLEIWNQEKHRKYYPHGTGHWLGLDVHDESPYLEEDLNEVKLAPGMVFTVEPGLYLPEHDSSIPTQYRGIAVRIEDDLLITEKSHENLTANIPKEIKEVEEACQQDYQQFL